MLTYEFPQSSSFRCNSLKPDLIEWRDIDWLQVWLTWKLSRTICRIYIDTSSHSLTTLWTLSSPCESLFSAASCGHPLLIFDYIFLNRADITSPYSGVATCVSQPASCTCLNHAHSAAFPQHQNIWIPKVSDVQEVERSTYRNSRTPTNFSLSVLVSLWNHWPLVSNSRACSFSCFSRILLDPHGGVVRKLTAVYFLWTHALFCSHVSVDRFLGFRRLELLKLEHVRISRILLDSRSCPVLNASPLH